VALHDHARRRCTPSSAAYRGGGLISAGLV
jgi:hypothetical protein